MHVRSENRTIENFKMHTIINITTCYVEHHLYDLKNNQIPRQPALAFLGGGFRVQLRELPAYVNEPRSRCYRAYLLHHFVVCTQR